MSEEFPLDLFELGQRWFLCEIEYRGGGREVVELECYSDSPPEMAPIVTSAIATARGSVATKSDGSAPEWAELWVDGVPALLSLLDARVVEWARTRSECSELSTRSSCPPAPGFVRSAVFGNLEVGAAVLRPARSGDPQHGVLGVTFADRAAAGHGGWTWSGCGSAGTPDPSSSPGAADAPASIYMSASVEICFCDPRSGCGHPRFNGVRERDSGRDSLALASDLLHRSNLGERSTWLVSLSRTFDISRPST